jgi:ubiquitin-conjugating enzyme E2 D/E
VVIELGLSPVAVAMNPNMTNLLNRITKELQELKKNPPVLCEADPLNGDIFHWVARIKGPDQTPYAGGVFHVNIIFPPTYPHVPPVVNFITPIFHANINRNGSVSIDILRDAWSPDKDVTTVLLSICSLLTVCTPEEPLVPEIAKLYLEDRAKHDAIARQWTYEHAVWGTRD